MSHKNCLQQFPLFSQPFSAINGNESEDTKKYYIQKRGFTIIFKLLYDKA